MNINHSHSLLLRGLLTGCMVLFHVGCGGSSDSDAPSVTISSPSENLAFSPGETFILSLDLSNFAFNRPDGIDPAVTGSQTGSITTEHAVLKHEAGGQSPVDMTNPAARQGHVHIYLDDASGKDSHITAWHSDVEVVLPRDITSGMHSLRVEMRDDHHVRLGSEYDQIFGFEVNGEKR